MSGVGLDAHRLCRFLLYENQILAMSLHPSGLVQNKQRMFGCYATQNKSAKSFRRHLEWPGLRYDVKRASVLLHLVIDRLIKHLLPLSSTHVKTEQQAEGHENGAEQADINPRYATRQKLATLFQELRRRNGVICYMFRDMRKADKLLKGIDLPTIVVGMQNVYAKFIKLMNKGLVLSAAAEEVGSLGLGEWPKLLYMDISSRY